MEHWMLRFGSWEHRVVAFAKKVGFGIKRKQDVLWESLFRALAR